jgi:hypothetical protein
VSDNVIRMDAYNPNQGNSGGHFIRTAQDNLGGNPSTGTPLGLYDVLIERNLFQFTDAAYATPNLANGVVWAEGGRITVRNNVADLRGQKAGQRIQFLNQSANISNCFGCPDDDNVVQGNVVFYDEDFNQDLDFCSSAATGSTGHVCDGNLVYRPLDAVVGSPDAGSSSGDDWILGPGWTQSGNLRTGTNPFAAPIPARASTALTDFQLSQTSAARDIVATPLRPWLIDAGGNCRPHALAHDAGAWEQGAVPCP